MTSIVRFSALLVCCLAALPAQAQEPKFYAGSATGSYFGTFCPHVIATISGKPFFFTDFKGCRVSKGSADNIERVLADPKAIGLAQADVAYAAAAEHPGKLAVSTADMGRECLFSVTNDKQIKDLSNLPPRFPLALAGEGSGSDRSFRFLQSLDPSLEALRNIKRYGSNSEAAEAVLKGEAVMAFFVQSPDMNNDLFKKLLAADNVGFVPVLSRQILRREVNGVRVYEPIDITLQTALKSALPSWLVGESPVLTTTCMRVVTVTGSPELFEAGTEAFTDQTDLLKALNSVTPPTTGGFGDIWKNMQQWSTEKLEQVQQNLGG